MHESVLGLYGYRGLEYHGVRDLCAMGSGANESSFPKAPGVSE
jgi:hypothetical protein